MPKPTLTYYYHPNGTINEYVRKSDGNLWYRNFHGTELLSDWERVDETDPDSIAYIYYLRSE